MFKPKLLKKEQGFTLVEVLVAILIATIFITVAMQMMVIASVFKVKAQENAEATNWIQRDLEQVRYQAGNLQLPQTKLAADAAKDAVSITVDSNSIFAADDTLTVGLDATNYTVTGVSGNVLTITPKLTLPQVINAAVVKTTICNSASRNVGLADALRDTLTSASTDNSNYVELSRSFRTGKQFIMRKTTTTSNNSPYNVLQIKYEVSPGTTFDSSKVIAKFDTEVIPNVAFKCPK